MFRQKGRNFTSIDSGEGFKNESAFFFPAPEVRRDARTGSRLLPVVPTPLRRGAIIPPRVPRQEASRAMSSDLLALPQAFASSCCPCWRFASASRASPSPGFPQDDLLGAGQVISIVTPPPYPRRRSVDGRYLLPSFYYTPTGAGCSPFCRISNPVIPRKKRRSTHIPNPCSRKIPATIPGREGAQALRDIPVDLRRP